MGSKLSMLDGRADCGASSIWAMVESLRPSGTTTPVDVIAYSYDPNGQVHQV